MKSDLNKFDRCFFSLLSLLNKTPARSRIFCALGFILFAVPSTVILWPNSTVPANIANILSFAFVVSLFSGVFMLGLTLGATIDSFRSKNAFHDIDLKNIDWMLKH